MENISFINKVKKLKQANIETYSQARRVTSDFRLEKDTTESYNGRQILELLQNCDDALQGYSNSDCVVDIELDFQNKILRVSNYGDPFTEDGVASLLVANTSEKGYELIGNKGLGFRSVLNWVEKVRIYTRNTIISFSEELVRREFEKQFSDEIQKKLIDDNRNRLEKGEVPMAILSMPEIVETDDKENYSTTIELHYLNDKQGDIVKQLSELNSKLLLFLNNIRQINIYLINADDILESERNRSIYINEEKSSDNLIVTNDGTWNLFDSGNIIFDKLNEVDRYYRIKLAWKDDLSDTSSMFYTFFPTHVPTHLPFLIHATFELDPTRNHLNNSSKGENQKILRHIARLMREEVLPKLCKSGGTWLPYKFLLPKHESSVGLLNGFYSMLQGYRNSEAIYPCVNNSYIRKDDAIYHGDKLSQWVLDNGLGEHFPNLIYPIGNVDVEIVGRYSFNEWEKIVERLNRLPEFTSMLRAQLLRILLKESDLNNYFAEIHKSDKKLSLLVNNMGKVIDATKRVFTKDTDEVEYDLPYFIHDIDFISSKFYGDIKTVLKKEIDRAKLDSESGPSRAIKRILDDIVNIGSDDIIDVIQHVVSQTNRELKDNENNSGVVIAMVSSLFSIYKSNPERRGNLTTINNIPLISRIGNIVNAGSLYFGKEYENGKYAEIIFEGVRDDRYYLADNDVWRLDDSRGMLAGFFTWLNVNTLSKFVRIEQKEGRYEESDYAGYMLNWRNHPRRDVHKEYKVESIEAFKEILNHENFSIEKLIGWIAKDDRLSAKLKSKNGDVFVIKFNKIKEVLSEIPSYLSFLIRESGITKNIVATYPINGLDSIRFIDYNHPIFDKLNLRSSEIEEILYQLRIKSSFNDLSPHIIYRLLKEVSLSEEQNSQQLYKLFYEYFRENEERKLKRFKPYFANLKYFARKGGVGSDIQLKPIEEVYYSDNKLLPQKILDNYWFINLPRRIGENRVKKFFGVKLIKDTIENTEISVTKTNRLNSELNRYIRSIKPYLLCYRLQTLKQNQNKKSEASLINLFDIELVVHAEMVFDNGMLIELENYDFHQIKQTFTLKYSYENSIKELQKDASFCDAIAEMCCIVFKVQDLKNTFRRIFKDGVKEATHLVRVDELTPYLNEARKLLGISVEEREFWELVFPSISFGERDDKLMFKNTIEVALTHSLPADYDAIDFSDLGNREGIVFLMWLSKMMSINLEMLLPDNALINWHRENLKDKIKDNSKKFTHLLWERANMSEKQYLKESFFKDSVRFEDAVEEHDFDEFIGENRFVLKPNYQSAIVKYSLEKFSVDLNSYIHDMITPKIRYSALISGYSFGNNFDDKVNILKEEKPSIHGLAFFDGYEEIVKQSLEELQSEENRTMEAETVNTVSDDGLQIFHSSIVKTTPTKAETKEGLGTYSYTSKQGKRKADAGKREEKRVIDALASQGYIVQDVASKRDSKHYDLAYKEKESDEWRYLEVKKDSGGFFFLSRAEKETAMQKNNREKYDIAIVNEKEVHIIMSPFDFKDESFEDNSKFHAEANEYIISFNIKSDD